MRALMFTMLTLVGCGGTNTPKCPDGLVCTPIVTCPDGYVCTQAGDGGVTVVLAEDGGTVQGDGPAVAVSDAGATDGGSTTDAALMCPVFDGGGAMCPVVHYGDFNQTTSPCPDFNNDLHNCGGCGIVCAYGCVSGLCRGGMYANCTSDIDCVPPLHCRPVGYGYTAVNCNNN